MTIVTSLPQRALLRQLRDFPHKVDGIAQPELAKNMRAVQLDRFDTAVEGESDFPRGASRHHSVKDFTFPARQAADALHQLAGLLPLLAGMFALLHSAHEQTHKLDGANGFFENRHQPVVVLAQRGHVN